MQPRILVGPTEVAGYATHLSWGLASLGEQVDCVLRHEHPFQYSVSYAPPWFVSLSRRAYIAAHSGDRTALSRLTLKIFAELVWSAWALYALVHYDVFLFCAGDTLLRGNVDLPILSLFRKTVVMNIGNGSDSRPPYLDGTWQHLDASRAEAAKKLAQQTRYVKRKVAMAEKYSSFVIGSAYCTSPFATKPYINYLCVGIPTDIEPDLFPEQSRVEKGEIDARPVTRILHAPSNRRVKGSDVIAKVVQRLREMDHPVTFVEVHGRPHAEVLQEISQCDFVVDQIYSDTPLAAFGAEAAALAKVSVVAGYSLAQIVDYVPENCRPFSITCVPDQLEATLLNLLRQESDLQELGNAARHFIFEKWSPQTVAERYRMIIRRTVPDEWWLDPRNVVGIHSAGQEISVTKRQIEGLVRHCGPAALKLDANPNLRAEVLAYARDFTITPEMRLKTM